MNGADIPFLTVVRFGNLDAVEAYLSSGQDVGVTDQLGMTALHWSVYHGKLEISLLLIAHGADVQATDASGETPMHYAAARRTTQMVELLLEHGATVNAVDTMGQSPLHSAAIWNGDRATSELLIAKGADATIVDKDGNTALSLAEDRLFDDLAALLRRHAR